jgi:hypothetical protein
MTPTQPTYSELTELVADLTLRLEEAGETLNAIRNGEVDAVLGGPQGDRIFTLKGADDPYRVLIEEMNQGAVTLSEDGAILYCNRRFAELVKRTIEEIVGFAFESLVAPAERETFLSLLQLDDAAASNAEIRLNAPDGTAVPLQLALCRLPADSAAAICLIATDISGSKQVEADLLLSRASLAEAQQSAQVGSWEWDTRTGELEWSDELYRIYDLDPATFVPSFEGYADLIHPEDRVWVMQNVERALHEQGFFNHDHRIIRPDGVERVVQARGRMVLDEAGESLKFVGTSQDVTERKAIEAELLRAKEAAELATRAKSEFLANMSHEIRTPMNGILGMTELVLDSKLDAEQREYLNMAQSSAQLLLSLINDILDFSKIEAGKLELEAIEFNLPLMIAQMLEPLHLRAKKKNIGVAVEIAGDVPDQLIGDPQRLRQILLNFADNALKFTERGSIVVKVQTEQENAHERCLHFSVTDTGIGIPEEKQAVIFEAFAQVDGSTTRNYGGTGLGLAIASRLIAQMRGKVWIESVIDKGTTFHFTGWFGTEAIAPATAPVRRDVAPVAEGLKRSLRILLVEDNAINRAVATAMLQKRGHTLAQAANGREALDAAAREPFDIIFMDVQLPEMDGFDATRSIRRMEQGTGRRTTIVAMTAHAMAGDRERCLASGMDGYLSKPLERASLIAVLDRASHASVFTVLQPDPETAARTRTATDEVGLALSHQGICHLAPAP